MGIDEPRTDNFSAGIDSADRVIGGVIDFPDSGYPAVAHRDIGVKARPTLAVDDGAVPDNQIVCHAGTSRKTRVDV